ncbi:hypothetical protein LshimejAT787_1301860 [Lyophyllum shimeji]|uniref:F-box domain-containing protein n=1 Tax=Lyophyllum shimeji TaxID=47721 RepID=A0A9P3UT72_LYOSH|nr:hypothetical protein LshimejAT787_1301860 [Lyophyllum shimeji]
MEEQTALAPLLQLPGELILHVLSFLNVPQVLTVRQTCTLLKQITHSRSLWLIFLRRQQEALPLPPRFSAPVDPRAPSESFAEPLTHLLESDVIRAHRIARSWARPRIRGPTKLTPTPGDSLIILEIFLDRWLLCAYAEGFACLWDLGASRSGSSAVRQTARLDLQSKYWSSLTAALCPTCTHVILALTCASTPGITEIHRVQLRPSASIYDPEWFELMHTLVSPVTQVARTIEPASQLVVLSSTNAVEVVAVDMSASSPNGNGKVVESGMSISTHNDDLDELLNSVVASRIMGPYIVLFKSRSIEMHPIDAGSFHTLSTPKSHHGQVLKHHFASSSVTFRSLSSSDCVLTEEGLSFTFFGYDFLQGILHFDVSVRFMHSLSGDASLDVTCVGVYPMSGSINMEALFPLRSSEPTLAQSPLTGIFEPRSRLPDGNVNSRGFVSAMALGPQGRRAVWIERKGGSLVRDVLVWSRSLPGTGQDGTGDVVIPRHVVYSVKSYDLREDLTHCAIGEVSGRIVLGNRAGDIFVLEVNY